MSDSPANIRAPNLTSVALSGACSIRQLRSVLETRADAMSAFYGSSHDVPRGDPVAVMNLLQGHPGIRQHLLHCGRVNDSRSRVRIQGFNQDANTTVREPRPHKLMRVIEVQQSGLDPDLSRDEEVAQLGDPFLSLVGGD